MFFVNTRPQSNARAYLKQKKTHSILSPCQANRRGTAQWQIRFLFYNIPGTYIAKLQEDDQHCLSGVVSKVTRFSRSVPLLKQIDLFPARFRINFKYALYILKPKKTTNLDISLN